MTEPRATNPAPVTGIAYGGLGTAANLEDTQLWSLEDLRESEASIAPEPMASRQADVAEASPARAPALQPLRIQQVESHRGRPRTGVLAAAAVGVVALAALFAMNDGLPGGATSGVGDGAGAFPSTPAISTAAPAPTSAPDAGGGGKGNGKGNGNGGDKGKN